MADPCEAVMATAEARRLEEQRAGTHPWQFWGPYLSDRQWGTVREDYSHAGNAWGYLSHEASRSRAYRWGEDGLGGFSDDHTLLCLAVALWNGKDPILKERLFGLAGPEGNHGEDVKEVYYHVDATPTHSFCQMLYKYPQAAFPYAHLVEENRKRGKQAPEYELLDTGIFDEDRYFDVWIEYAKETPHDVLMRVRVINRGPEPAKLHVLPTLWYRNTWAWEGSAAPIKPRLQWEEAGYVSIDHPDLPKLQWFIEGESTPLLFCENDTNRMVVFGEPHERGYWKDGIHEAVVNGKADAVNPYQVGSKVSAHFQAELAPGASAEFHAWLRPPADEGMNVPSWDRFREVFTLRQQEADEFYAAHQAELTDADARRVQRQAWAGMIWTKQYYKYDVRRWLAGDPGRPAPESRKDGRNSDWDHFYASDIISMPDKWEYPWFAAWDLAFHCLPLAQIDPEFAKHQLDLLTREWYMHPNGQLPAYEWEFGDVNPPVHAWATWRVFQIDRKTHCGPPGDLAFLERVFHKLLLNFTWWVNRKDAAGRNIFQGGFLGLDNIGVFDRSAPLPTGGRINQADGTAWMAMYSLNMLRMALELARHNRVYEDIATKFFNHFLAIADSMMNMGGRKWGLWDDEDEFYYDELAFDDGRREWLKVRSIVGLIPLFAVETIEPEMLECLPDFGKRMEWVLANRPDLAALVSHWEVPGLGQRRLLSLLRGHRMKCLLRRMLNPDEFLSDYGIRALSRHHLEHPYVLNWHGQELKVQYVPGDSDSGMFGGNSNWRGPIWMPINYLLVESLERFHHYYGDEFKIECPTGSGRYLTLLGVADELKKRLCRLFLKDKTGRRPAHDYHPKLANDPHFCDNVLFHEYFHGDSGRGLGASHQTGWTGLVAKLIQPRK